MIIQLHYDKYNHCILYAIAMKDESHANMFADNDWIYVFDGKKHGRIPAIVLPKLVNMFGGEQYIREQGYRKHWCVHQNTLTGECTFGNKPAFSNSPFPEERERANNMIVVDIQQLLLL